MTAPALQNWGKSILEYLVLCHQMDLLCKLQLLAGTSEGAKSQSQVQMAGMLEEKQVSI